ncbi:MAG: U32 family peptidase [Treponema sp.]|jgi:putative protease|nr:U32 family peptidase [Treponema sp.]
MSIELLAPAGSPEALDAAVGEGADAVYLGLKNFNARMRSANFTYAQFEAALRSLRRMGKRVYVTVNTVFEQREADRMYQLLKYLAAVGPDALIIQDFGVLAMVRSEFPQLKLHASTQMNVASGRGANALSKYGVSRVVLARELSREELRSIRSETNMELEVFVHGALCVSASGLCLFSGYLGGKSANRGMCTQACRRLYHNGEDNAGAVTEKGYYFSPADLQLLEYLPDLAVAGINALKIEGRMKSADYVGAVVSAYRLVLDAMSDSGDEEKIRRSIAEGQKILRGDFARSKTSYFFNAAHTDNNINWLNPAQDGGTGISLGVIAKVQGKAGERRAMVCGSEMSPAVGVVAVGDSIRLHRSDDSERVSHKVQYAEAAADGLWLSIPDGFDKGDRVYLIQTKTMSKRHKPVIAHNAGTGGRGPGHEKAPPLPALVSRKAAQPKNKSAAFPDGLYVATSRINDLYIIQSSRPARVMLSLTRKTINYLLGEDKPPLPFKSAEIILVLEPFFPQAAAEELAGIISPLVERGYRQFIVNNLGHFSLFRDIRPEVQLIAGPWLYTFNAWALSYVLSLGVDGFVSPLENNRQNWERTIDVGNRQMLRSLAFVPVFAWPPLFHIRADLGPLYDFTAFSDNRGECFSLVCGPEGSTVFPEKPFSITDKIPFLKEAGFRRFIIDVAGNFPGGRLLKKTDYKDLMRAADNGTPLPRISRFNWKNGFYTTEKQTTMSKEQR